VITTEANLCHRLGPRTEAKRPTGTLRSGFQAMPSRSHPRTASRVAAYGEATGYARMHARVPP